MVAVVSPPPVPMLDVAKPSPMFPPPEAPLRVATRELTPAGTVKVWAEPVNPKESVQVAVLQPPDWLA